MMPSFTMTAPTRGFGFTLPSPLAASARARSKKCRSRSRSSLTARFLVTTFTLKSTSKNERSGRAQALKRSQRQNYGCRKYQRTAGDVCDRNCHHRIKRLWIVRGCLSRYVRSQPQKQLDPKKRQSDCGGPCQKNLIGMAPKDGGRCDGEQPGKGQGATQMCPQRLSLRRAGP